jgi:DNA-binding MarR family transcriptional regulator
MTPHLVNDDLIDAAISASRAFNGVAVHVLSEHFPDVVTLPILRTLWLLSNQGEIRMSDLSAILNLTAPTAGRVCGKLEQHGCVTRRIDPGDRRGVLVSLTEKGQGIFDSSIDGMRSVFATILGNIPQQQQAVLAESLNVIFMGAKEMGVVWP